MVYSVDWATKVITIPKADLTPIVGTLYELDTEVFRNELHTIQASETGIVFSDIFSRNAPYTVAGVTYAQSIQIINGYSITFEDGTYSVRLIGSNNDIFDIQNGILNQNSVQVIPNNSAGLVDLNKEDIEHGAYNGAVSLDAINGGSGTTHPWGTTRPEISGGTYALDNLSDALAVAAARGFRQLDIRGDWTFGATDNIDNYEIRGYSQSQSFFTFTAGCSTSQTEFFDAELAGVLNGALSITNCHVEALSGVGGNLSETNIHDTIFENNPYSIKLTAGATKHVNIIDCASEEPGYSPAVIDMNGTGPDMVIRHWQGGIKLTNATNGQLVSLDTTGGHLTIDSTCTNMTIVVRGDTKITDNSVSGVTLIDQTTPTLVWDHPTGQAIYSQMYYRRVISAITSREIYYDIDNLPILQCLLWKDEARTIPYDGTGAAVRDKVTAYVP